MLQSKDSEIIALLLYMICGLDIFFSLLFLNVSREGFWDLFSMVGMLCCGVFPDAEWVHSSHLPLVLSGGSRLTGLSTCQ